MRSHLLGRRSRDDRGLARIMRQMRSFPSLVGLQRSRTVARSLAAVAAVASAACSPALDWRETTIDGPALTALFPCRPVGQSREVPLAGAPVPLRLLACEAGGSTFAVSVADVHDPAAVGPAMAALREGSLGKLAASPQSASSVVAGWSVAGATPQPAAGRWQASGQRPDGSPLSLETALFSRGTWVIQASLIGAKPDPATSGPFFDGLRFAQ